MISRIQNFQKKYQLYGKSSFLITLKVDEDCNLFTVYEAKFSQLAAAQISLWIRKLSTTNEI